MLLLLALLLLNFALPGHLPLGQLLLNRRLEQVLFLLQDLLLLLVSLEFSFLRHVYALLFAKD